MCHFSWQQNASGGEESQKEKLVSYNSWKCKNVIEAREPRTGIKYTDVRMYMSNVLLQANQVHWLSRDGRKITNSTDWSNVIPVVSEIFGR